jgi:hypothetical protein
MNEEHILRGKTILAIMIAQDKEALLFKTDAGDIVARCDADCCSHTWVENIEMPALGLPALVVETEDLHLADDAWETGGCIQFYGFKITTDRGEIVIDYRNSSNGYYGGWLTWPEDCHYGGVFGQNNSSCEWTPVEVVP